MIRLRGARASNEAAAEGGSSVPIDTPLSGGDVVLSGRAWRGASVGFGASAERVRILPPAPPPSRWRDGPSAVFAADVFETPVLLNANLGFGTMQADGAGGRSHPGAIRFGGLLAASRSVPLLGDGT